MANTSLETLEIISNCTPMHLHLKLRQDEEMIRIYSKNEGEQILEDFNNSIEDITVRGKRTTFNVLLSTFNELKEKISLENLAKDFKYTNDCMLLNRQNKANCTWDELENDKTAQEENMKQILEGIEEDCAAVFTDGSALRNPGATGAGAVLYLNGLQSDPIGIKKGICSNGNNYLGEILGIELALKYLCDEAKVKNRNIHLFVDCQSAIVSAFGIGIPKYKVDIILNIRRLTSLLENDNNNLKIHWIPGHKAFEGNERADRLAKEAAKEMEGKKEEFYEGVDEKKEIIQIMRSTINDKWQRLMDNSGLTDKVQVIVPKAGKAFVVKSEERKVTRVMNQLISGNSNLNYMISKIDNTKSELCYTCKVKETINHYIYDCDAYDENRKMLEKDIERILAAYGLQHIPDINLKLMTGNIEEAPGAAKLELRDAPAGFITRTGRFTKSKN